MPDLGVKLLAFPQVRRLRHEENEEGSQKDRFAFCERRQPQGQSNLRGLQCRGCAPEVLIKARTTGGDDDSQPQRQTPMTEKETDAKKTLGSYPPIPRSRWLSSFRSLLLIGLVSYVRSS